MKAGSALPPYRLAEEFNLPVDLIRAAIESGELAAIQKDGEPMVTEAEFHRWLSTREVPAKPLDRN